MSMACGVAAAYGSSEIWGMEDQASPSSVLFTGYDYFVPISEHQQQESKPQDLQSTDDYTPRSKQTESEPKEKPAPLLPNVLANTLVARFKRVKVKNGEERKQVFEPPQWLDKCRPAKARGNLGRFVRYPDECYMFGEVSVERDAGQPTRGESPETQPLDTVVVVEDEDDTRLEPVTIHNSKSNITSTQEAIVAARKILRKTRAEAVSGVPKDLKPKEVKIKFISDDRRPRRKRKSQREIKWGKTNSAPVGQKRDSVTKSGETETRLTDPFSKVPGLFVFPKLKDFIKHERKNKLAGFDWNVRDESSDTRATTGRFFHKLNRREFPLTEALHREGTSITKRKAAVLNKPGMFDVAKVWMRPSNKFDLPVVMAKGDIYLEPDEEFRLPTPPPPEKYPIDPWDLISM